jgi:hypothetical protein
MSKSCANSPTPNRPERSINFIAEERANVLLKHQLKRKDDYAKNITPIKTGCEQDEPDIVSNLSYFFKYNYYYLCFIETPN